ncbi:hypothetical protein LZ009_21340 [Ramlibacter sp. XY19]|uniref:hypothetical protein n=1 Tax=Ramlibacter paludis TaxID=2908000 RepID=UPI0023DCD144|nr:hypothetical protein [Ramlibacter paludis]MCG2595331.1 hypothetical protein [Ramlibacter paludis]
MTIEVPVLRLGLAGFSEAQQRAAAEVIRLARSARAEWQIASFPDADAWWLEGSRTMVLPGAILRVQPGVPSGRSVQLALADVDRPVGFTLPLSTEGFQPAVTFDAANLQQSVAVLNQFANWLQNMLSQFCLASNLAEQQPALSSGSWEVLRGSDLLAVVDLRLGAAVAPGVGATDLADASWCIRDHGAVKIPAGFPRSSVSQLMWQYALRTTRDLLPPHYRQQPLYFRRPPKLPQRQLRDVHLLLLRELVAQPGLDFEQLQQATGLAQEPLARCLAALYVVGSITANPRRAESSSARRPVEDSTPGTAGSVFLSELDPTAFTAALRGAAAGQYDRTAPAPLVMDKTMPAPLMPELGRG